MRSKTLLAALVAALVAGAVATSVATAGPTRYLKITPAAVNFGSVVPVGTMVIKPVTITNKTGEWVEYASAVWPGQSGMWPNGIWNVDPDNPSNTAPFHCWTIAPDSSCTEYFEFTPYFVGPFTALNAGGDPTGFSIVYQGLDTGNYYTSPVVAMWGKGIEQ